MEKHSYVKNQMGITKAALKFIGVFVLYLICASSITAANGVINTNTAALATYNSLTNSIVDTSLSTGSRLSTGNGINIPSELINGLDTTRTVHVGQHPRGVAVSPDGKKVYVANVGSNTVSVIDTATDKVTATVNVESAPCSVTVSPDGKKVYAYVTGMIYIIDTETNTVIETVRENSVNYEVTSPNREKLYVANVNSNTVSVIDTTTDKVTAKIRVGLYPRGIALSSDGNRVYVANINSNTVSVIDTATNNVTTTIDVGESPLGVAVSPDGKKVYVANVGSNTVSVIDTATNNVTATINVGSYMFGVAVSPDGKKVYVTNSKFPTFCRLYIIDTTTNNVTASDNVEKNPTAVALSPDGKKVYVTNSGSNTISIFDMTPPIDIVDESYNLYRNQIREQLATSALQQSNVDPGKLLKVMQ